LPTEAVSAGRIKDYPGAASQLTGCQLQVFARQCVPKRYTYNMSKLCPRLALRQVRQILEGMGVAISGPISLVRACKMM